MSQLLLGTSLTDGSKTGILVQQFCQKIKITAFKSPELFFLDEASGVILLSNSGYDITQTRACKAVFSILFVHVKMGHLLLVKIALFLCTAI